MCRLRCDGGELDVAYEAVAALLAGVFNAVDADVDDVDAVFDHVFGDEIGASDRGDEHVCLARDAWQVGGAGVADGHGGVAWAGFLHHE